jgi:uroporphyrinogen decarboxylase
MSDREWIRRTVTHKETAAVPYNFMLSPPAAEIAAAHFGEDLDEALALPIRGIGPKPGKPFCTDPTEYGDTIVDEFGITWSTSAVDRGSPIGPCLPEPDLSDYRFPDPTDRERYVDVGEWHSRTRGHYRIAWVGDLWERATFMRGMENLLLDLTLNPGFVEALLHNLADYVLATAEVMLGNYRFDAVAISDDYGTQKGMLMSPENWRRFVRPSLASIYDFAKSRDCAVFHHSCGHVTPIIGDLVDMGLDILHPVQPEAMDLTHLKRKFGKDLTFCGGFPTQKLLGVGSPDDIRAEVRRLKTEMGKGGGYILEPGLTVQPEVPAENVIALLDETVFGT